MAELERERVALELRERVLQVIATQVRGTLLPTHKPPAAALTTLPPPACAQPHTPRSKSG